MACVAALHALAVLDRDSTVSADEKWTHPDYPGVVLYVAEDPKSPITMTARWATFLINAGIRDMMLRQRYESAIFWGWFRDVRVGSAIFASSRRPPRLSLLQRPQDVSMIIRTGANHTTLTYGRSRSRTGIELATGDTIHAEVTYLEKAMDRRDSMIMIIYLMMSLGGRDYEPLKAYQCIFQAITVEVRTIWNAAPAPPKTYVINSMDLVNFLAHLAVVILRERKFAEMNVVISDDGVVLVRGAVRTRPISPKPGGTLPSTLDVSSA
ncbi:MAG: hypothetical protein Q9216_006967 [Gyalolechia sp. 2 TL-2023]